jgi:hypothetical protein
MSACHHARQHPASPCPQVNLPTGDYYRLQQRAADSDFISQVLCVTADHNPSLGRSYPGALRRQQQPVG